MELSRSILKEFATVTNGIERPEKTIYLRGTIKSSGDSQYVRIDGSESLTPISEIVDVKEGDRVLVTIENHQATIIGNLTKPPSSYKEDEAIDKANEANDKATDAKTLAESAQKNADDAIVISNTATNEAKKAKEDAAEALDLATTASAQSAQAKLSADEAAKNASTAVANASEAQNSATAAQGEVTRINAEVTRVRSDLSTTIDDVANQQKELQATKESMELNFAKKTEVSDMEVTLNTEISKKIGELQTSISESYAAKNDVVDLEGRIQTQVTQNSEQLSSVASKVETLETDTQTAVTKVNDALTKSYAAEEAAKQAQADAQESQNLANQAKQNALDANTKADQAIQEAANAASTALEADKKLALARTDLDEAQENLANVTNRVGATEDEIELAKQRVSEAQTAVQNAQEEAAEATLAANNAKAAADKATTDATEAQTAAVNAQRKADNATSVADAATRAAAQAQADVAALTSRVTTAETKINQNADAIELTATKTEEIGNELVNNYYSKSQVDAALTVKADSITQHVSSTYATKVNTIKSSVEEFYQSTSPTALSGGSWSTTQPVWTQGKYIWRRTKNTFGDDTVTYVPSTNGVCITGNTGATGANGQNGKGVSSYSVTYQAGTSGTTAPTGTWTTSIPSVPQGQYLWTKMVITYTDNTSTTSYSVSYIPVNGQNGATGATGATGPAGNGVSSITAEFYLSTSKTTQTGGSWSTSQPTWSPGKYVWTRNKITYTNGSTAYTTPQCSSEWEAVNELQVGGRNLFKDTANFGNSGMPSGAKDGWLDSSYATLENEKYNGLTVRSLKNVTSQLTMCRYRFTGFNLGDTYTLSFWAKGTINRFVCYFYGASGYVKAQAINASIPFYGGITYGDGSCVFVNPQITNWTRISVTWKLADSGDINILKNVLIRTDGATSGDLYICGVKFEKGNQATDWSPAPEDMATAEQAQNAQNTANTANSKADAINTNLTNNYYTKTVVDAKTTVNGEGITSYVQSTRNTVNTIQGTMATQTQLSTVSQKADKIESEIYDSSTGLKTKVTQLTNSWAVTTLSKAGDVLSQLNVNGGSVKIKSALIELDGYTTITEAFINKLTTNSIVTQTIDARSATITNAAVTNLNATNIKSGYLDVQRIQSGSITSDKIKSGSITSDKLYISSLSAISSNIGIVTNGKLVNSSGTFEINATTGVISSKNGGDNVKISAGNLTFGTDSWTATMSSHGLNLIGGGLTEIRPSYIYIGSTSTSGLRIGNFEIYIPGESVSNDPFHINAKWANKVIVSEGANSHQRIFNIQITGSSSNEYIHVATADGSAFGVSKWNSDEKLKKNIAPKPDRDSLNKILQVPIRQFDWKSNDKHVEFGIIAQEVMKVLPDAVFDVDGTYQIDSSGLIPPMVGAIKELNRKLEKLEAENFLLQAKLEAIT